MQIISWVQFLAGVGLLFAGIVIFMIQILGAVSYTHLTLPTKA